MRESGHPGEISNGVLIGYDSYLFLVGGNHDVIDFAQGRRSPSPESFVNFRRNLIQRSKLAAARNAGYLHVIFPDKHTILRKQFPLPLSVSLGTAYVDFCQDTDVALLFPRTDLESCKGQSFLKLDTHLSDEGVAVTAIRIAEALLQVDLKSIGDKLLSHIRLRRAAIGDLGSKLGGIAPVEESYLEPWWKAYLFTNGFSGNNGLVDVWHSPSSLYSHRLLVFGDSFGRSMSRVLTCLFRDVVFARTPFFHVDLVDQIRPDYIITDNAERYLSNVLGDWERPSFHMYPFMISQQNSCPSPDFAKAFSAMLCHPRKPYQDFMSRFSPGAQIPL